MVAGNALYGGDIYGITLWELYLGDDRSNVKIAVGLPPSDIQTDYGEDGLAYGGRRLLMVPVDRLNRS